ncbi:MAG: sigma-70 family RNA polymerase sigma factor [Pyrinomonadaceae bacterium]
MALIREPGRYDCERGTVTSFLYGVARNHLRRLLDKSRWLVQLSEEMERGETSDAAAALETLSAQSDLLADPMHNQMIDRLRQSILALPTHYREVVVLCDLHEMSYAEAATVLDCAVGTVRSRLHRSRTMLIGRLRGAVDASTASETEKVHRVRCLA